MYWIKNGSEYIIGAVQPENSIQVPQRPTVAHNWDGTQWVFDGFTQEQADSKLRSQRNAMLSETDWWCVSDRTPTPEQLQYRAALRDLPANCTPALDENGNLTGVEWPAKPQ